MVRLWKDKFVLVLMAVTLIVLLSIWQQMVTKGEVPVVKEGVLDLRGWNLDETGIFPLDGEWDFYPNVLLTPDDTRNLVPGASTIRVPGNWDGWKDDRGGTMKGKGYGTYRLLIRNAPTDQTLAIAKKYVRFADRLYVDGFLMGESGSPGISRDTYKPRNSPYTVYFRPSGSEVEVLLQAANFDFRSGGIFSSIELGLGQDMEIQKNVQIGLEMMAAVVLLLFGLLFFFLYYRLHRESLQLLYAAFFLFYGLTILMNGERLVLQLFPGVPFELAYKIKYVSVYVTPALVFVIASKLLAGRWVCRWLQGSSAMLFVYMVAILALPFRHYSFLQDVCYVWVIATYILLMFVLIRQYGLRRYGTMERPQYQILIASVWLLLISSMLAILNSWNLVSLVLVNATGLLFLLAIALLLVYQYVRAYDSLQQLTYQLQMADRMKDEFLLITSHELNTPLNGIIHLSRSLLASPLRTMNDTEVQEKLQLIRNTAYRMSSMVKDIIDLSRFKDGVLVVTKETVDLVPCVSVVMEVSGFLANGNHMVLTHHMDPKARYVVADENRLLQVFYNVIFHILGNRNDGVVSIESRAEGEAVHIVIRPTGSSKTEQPQASQRADSSMQVSGGTIGLSIAYELVELMGGKLHVDQATGIVELTLTSAQVQGEGQGASVVVSPDEAPPGRRTDHSDSSYLKEAVTILVATADPVIVENMNGMLTLEGFRVQFVKTEREAHDLVSSTSRQDLVIVDAMLPETNGFELCRHIRREFTHVELPVLVINARSSPADIEASIAAGGSDFVARPLDAGEIRVRIHALLAMKRLVQEAAVNEIAFLRSQIKPHFLYNALGTIMSLCYTNGEKAGELLGTFSHYLRIIFHQDNTEETIPLSKELELVQAYVDIEQARFGERLRVEFDVDEQLSDCRVAPLMIEPLVENAIRHGVSKKVTGGTVRLTIRKHGDLVQIVVEDDGVGMTPEQVQSMFKRKHSEQGIGLQNMMRRLAHLTGHTPVVDSVPGKGTKVTILFPIKHSAS